MTDYYQIMGVDKNADEEAIKKAYRKLALQLHPDRNPGDKEAEEKFKEVQGAYETLVNPEKRRAYDRRGEVPVFNTNFNHQDLFDMFFTQQPRQSDWGQHIQMELIIDFMESIKGCSKSVTFDKREVCKSCKGTASQNGKEFKKCVVCDGRGRTIEQRGGSGSFFRIESTCSSCKGSGKVVSILCTDCNAKGYHIKTTNMELKIPSGIGDGMKICARGVGDVGPTGVGNLYCVIRVKAHPIFTREGTDILLKVPITYSQAVLGDEITIPCLDGETKLKIPSGTNSGAVFRKTGLGTNLPEDDECGDLLVKVIIDVPDGDDLSEKYKELMKQIIELEKESPGDSINNFKKNMEEHKNG